MKTVATFRSSKFNTTETKDYFINPECFGDDLARWLISRLRSTGTSTADGPGQEDFGWYFDFVAPEGPHTCVIGFRADDSTWVIWTERRRGLIASIFGARNRDISNEGVKLLHRALSDTLEITDLRWHERKDFDAGREDRSSAEP
jgi:hypothetical protein